MEQLTKILETLKKRNYSQSGIESYLDSLLVVKKQNLSKYNEWVQEKALTLINDIEKWFENN